jgi:ABC-type sugar transport system, periplasmic component
MNRPRNLWIAAASLALAVAMAPAAKAEDTTLTVWSHEADEPAKVALREQAARNLEASHPGVHVKITWYEKDGLYTALRTALPAGQGPDIFYLEPDQTEYITNGYIIPLDNLVNWNNIYDGPARSGPMTARHGPCPEEAYTVELYYNKDRLAKLGVSLPASDQFDQTQFLDLVKKARAPI